MPKTYPQDVRLRAVALAEATDLDTASKTLGIPAQTIERWMAEAPAKSDLQRAHDLALSEVTVRLAKGESSIGLKHLTTVAAILADKVARHSKAPAAPTGPTALEARDQLEDWIVDNLVDPADLTDEAAYEAHHMAIDTLESELLRLANGEPDQPHRPTFLAWHSGRADVIAARGFLDWAKGHLSRLVAEHGDPITAATEARRAEQERRTFDHDLTGERAMRVRLYVESGLSVKQAIERAAQPVELDADTLALLERAEAELAMETP